MKQDLQPIDPLKYMQQGVEFAPLSLDVESCLEESFGGLFSPFEEYGFERGKTTFFGEKEGENTNWDKVQELPSPPFGGLGGDFDMELEFFRTEIDSEGCKIAGPTLAELNDHRSLSPLINPEMERLHRIATRTEGENSSSGDSTTTRKPQPYIALELTAEKIERPRLNEMKRDSNYHYGGRVEVQKETTEKKLPSKPTWTMTQDTSWHNEREKSASSERIIVLPQRKLGTRSDGEVCNSQVPKLISAEMKSRLYNNEVTTEVSAEKVQKNEPESIVNEPDSPAMEEESADEYMDSDEDFDVESHLHGTGVARNRKGRRGDQDDLSPNPRKLLEIIRELERLNKIIGDLKPIHQLPQNARNKSRKEKNKLASRACRLKKKAQHEANKVKLQGLEMEQQRLTDIIGKVKKEIIKKANRPATPKTSLSSQVESLMKATFGNQLVAGHTSDFVHSVLKATAQENPTFGELDELSLCF